MFTKRLSFMLLILVGVLAFLGPKIYTNFFGSSDDLSSIANKAKSAITNPRGNKVFAEVNKDKIDLKYLAKTEYKVQNTENPFEFYRKGASPASSSTAFKIDPKTGKAVPVTPTATAKTAATKPMRIVGKLQKGDEQRIYFAVGENTYWAQPGRILDGMEILDVDSENRTVTIAQAGKTIVIK